MVSISCSYASFNFLFSGACLFLTHIYPPSLYSSPFFSTFPHTRRYYSHTTYYHAVEQQRTAPQMDSLSQPNQLAANANQDRKANQNRNVIDEINQSFKERISKSRSPYDYDHVFALVLCWEYSDHDGFETEAEQMHRLFAETFGYESKLLQIPNDLPTQFVKVAILNLIVQNKDPNTLFIIYYGGHGERAQERDVFGKLRTKCVWSGLVKLLL